MGASRDRIGTELENVRKALEKGDLFSAVLALGCAKIYASKAGVNSQGEISELTERVYESRARRELELARKSLQTGDYKTALAALEEAEFYAPEPELMREAAKLKKRAYEGMIERDLVEHAKRCIERRDFSSAISALKLARGCASLIDASIPQGAEVSSGLSKIIKDVCERGTRAALYLAREAWKSGNRDAAERAVNAAREFAREAGIDVLTELLRIE